MERVSHLKVSNIGLRAFNEVQEFVKPTTRLIQVFGRLATKGVHPIDEEQLADLCDGKTLSGPADTQDGYIILSLNDQPLGLGLLIKGTIRSQLPRKDFLFIKR